MSQKNKKKTSSPPYPIQKRTRKNTQTKTHQQSKRRQGDKTREHRNNGHPETAVLLRQGHGTAKQGATTQSDDMCADSQLVGKTRDQVGHRTTGSEPREMASRFIDPNKVPRKTPRRSLELEPHYCGSMQHRRRVVEPGGPRSSRTVHGQAARRDGENSSERRAARVRDAQSRKGGGE